MRKNHKIKTKTHCMKTAISPGQKNTSIFSTARATEGKKYTIVFSFGIQLRGVMEDMLASSKIIFFTLLIIDLYIFHAHLNVVIRLDS